MLNFLAAIAAAVLNDKIGNEEIAGWIAKAIKAVNAGRLVNESLDALTAEIVAYADAGTNPDDEDFDALKNRSDEASDAIQGVDLGQGGGPGSGEPPNAAAGAPAGDGGGSGSSGAPAGEGSEGSDPPVADGDPPTTTV